MTEALEKSVKGKVRIYRYLQAIKLLTENNRIQGLIMVDTRNFTLQYILCQNIVLATGGPAHVYADVAYPISQTGGTGLALEAGAAACNLSEWQYGLASVDFRWNVSGTYQQVLPKYISVDENGQMREILANEQDMVFLKGYQWPFDVCKINGSSSIDLAIAKEINDGCKVYMDFRQNPSGLDFDKLAPITHEYLSRSGALFGTPIERLAKMNPKAIEIYKDNGIDLYKEPLRVAVCAQHCNGGIAVDANWQSTVEGLYVVGEAAGTFGVYRPGGSALNSTQVGSMRAAEHISQKSHTEPSSKVLDDYVMPHQTSTQESTAKDQHEYIQTQMSRHAAYIRNLPEMRKLYNELLASKENFFEKNSIQFLKQTPQIYKYYDALVTQIAILSAMIFAAENIGSRGGALVKDAEMDKGHYNDQVITTHNNHSFFEPVRPMPICDNWFETVWNDYNEEVHQ